MVQFMNMPAVEYPRSALLDFSPVSNALAGYTQGINANEQRKRMQAIGQSAATGGYGDAAKAAFGAGELDAGLQFKKLDQNDAELKKKRFGAMAQMVDMEQDPARRSKMWDAVLKRLGNPATLSPEEMDPVNGPKMLMAEAGLVNDPQDREFKQAQIAKMRADAAGGGELPSNIKEWQEFNKMTPDQQQKYLVMKRSIPYLDTGTGYTQPNAADPTAAPRVIPKDVAGAEAQKAIGDSQGKALAGLPLVELSAQRMLDTIDAVANDPNLPGVTGFVGGRTPRLAQTEAQAESQSRVDQLQGQTFLQAYNDLRGAGAISEREGSAAQSAYNRVLTQTMGTDAYRAALREFRSEVLKLIEVARQRAGSAGQTQPGDATQRGFKYIGPAS